MGWLGDSSHIGQGCQAWTAVELLPRYPLMASINKKRRVYGKPPQCYGTSQAVWAHSVTCHQMQGNKAHLNPSQGTWYLIYLPRRDGRLSWPTWTVPRWFTWLQMVTHPSSNRAKCRVTTLIKTNVLPLSQATTNDMEHYEVNTYTWAPFRAY